RAREGPRGLRREREADEVDRGELALVFVGMAGLERPWHRKLLAYLHPHRRPEVNAHEAIENGLDLLLLGDLDEEAGAELVRGGEERVVDVDLVLDLCVVGDALVSGHLLALGGGGGPSLRLARNVPAPRVAAGPRST